MGFHGLIGFHLRFGSSLISLIAPLPFSSILLSMVGKFGCQMIHSQTFSGISNRLVVSFPNLILVSMSGLCICVSLLNFPLIKI